MWKTLKGVNNNNIDNNDNNNNDKKENLASSGFGGSDGPLSENKRKQKDKQRIKKLWKMGLTVISIVFDAFGSVSRGVGKGREKLVWFGFFV